MIKNVLKDYWNSRKQGLKNIKYSYIGNLVWCLYFPFVRYSFNIMGVIVFTFGCVLAKMYPNQLSKMMILCPMSKKERKEYLFTGYIMRIVLPIICYCVGEMVSLLFRHSFVWEELAVFFVLLVFLPAENLNMLPKKRSKELMKRSYYLPEKSEVMMYILEIVSGFELLVFCAAEDVWRPWEICIVTGLFVCETVLSIYLIYSRFYFVMEMGMSYEFLGDLEIANK